MQYVVKSGVSTRTFWKLSPQHMAKDCPEGKVRCELAQDRSSHLQLQDVQRHLVSILHTHRVSLILALLLGLQTTQTGKHCIQKCSAIIILKSGSPSSTSTSFCKQSACTKAAPWGFGSDGLAPSAAGCPSAWPLPASKGSLGAAPRPTSEHLALSCWTPGCCSGDKAVPKALTSLREQEMALPGIQDLSCGLKQQHSPLPSLWALQKGTCGSLTQLLTGFHCCWDEQAWFILHLKQEW